MEKLAPIVLFVYNRPWHTKQTVEALQKNELASESELFIFSDGPKNETVQEGVRDVREYIKTIKGFKKVHIIERDKNWGLANNIIDGVTKIVNEYGRVIVLEDDLVTSPAFLRYMNEGLEIYENVERVFHISGYMYPISKKDLPELFFLKQMLCWGWATWARAWKYFERNPEKQSGMLTRKQIRNFNLNHSYNYWRQLVENKKGSIFTWAVFWYLSIYLQDGLCLNPRDSLVKNIGFDNSGMHSGETKVYDVELSMKTRWDFPQDIEEHQIARKSLEKYFRSIKSPFYIEVLGKILPDNIKLFLRKFLKRVKKRGR